VVEVALDTARRKGMEERIGRRLREYMVVYKLWSRIN
jgi:hypothetical protein